MKLTSLMVLLGFIAGFSTVASANSSSSRSVNCQAQLNCNVNGECSQVRAMRQVQTVFGKPADRPATTSGKSTAQR